MPNTKTIFSGAVRRRTVRRALARLITRGRELKPELRRALWCLLAVGGTVGSQAQVWNGGGSDNKWKTGANWAGGNAPVTDGTASVSFNGNLRLAPDVDKVWEVNSISFLSGASSFTLGGSELRIRGGGVQNSSSNSQSIQNNITFREDQTWNASGGDLNFSGSISKGNYSLTIDGSRTTTISGSISGGYTTTVKNGSGTLILSGANSFSGPLDVNAGVVSLRNSSALGSSTYGNTVSSGAALELQGGINVSEGDLKISGTGVSGGGALRNVSGNNSFSAQLIVDGSASVGNDSGTLSLSGSISLDSSLTIGGSGSTEIDSHVYGSGDLIKTGSGTLTLDGSAGLDHSGTTRVESGTLVVNKGAGANEFNAAIIVGTSSSTATMRLDANEQIRNDLSVRVNQSSTLDLSGRTETLGGATLQGGTISTGTGTLILGSGGNVGVTALGSTTSSTISGNLKLDAYSHTFDVADGGAAVDLDVTASLTGGGILEKNGSGALRVAGNANSYTGSIKVNSGTLLLGGSNNIKDSVGLTLAGGKLSADNNSETLNTLTMTSDSTIDLGSSSGSILNFANSSGGSWSGTLTIQNWSGSSSGGGSDRIYFGSSGSGLTSSQLSQIRWSDPYGSGEVVGAVILNSGEIVPARAVPLPEPATVVTVGLLAAGVGYRERRRLIDLVAKTWSKG